jgi:sec-independent protein translocase protein TatC
MKINKKNFSNFFKKKKNDLKKEDSNNVLEVIFEEHFQEIRQRFFQSFFFICLLIVKVFLNVNLIVEILEKPVANIKFFQLSPGEYFISTLEISLFFGLLITSPIFLNQLVLFFFPSFNKKEKTITRYLIISSLILFSLGLIFSYFVLIPSTLGFFINYGKNIIEPLLSFNKYISFIGILFFCSGILFQIPILQILLSLFNIFSGEKMFEIWKYVIIFATIISGIFTPSVDPITQSLLAIVIILLYFIGSYGCTFLKPI